MLVGVWPQNLHQKLRPSTSTKDSGSNVEAPSFSSFTDEHNWIRAYFSLPGQLLFLFLSSLHVISLTFPSVAYDKSNWPSLHSSKEDVFYFRGLFPPLLSQSWTHQKKKKKMSWVGFFFWGGRVIGDNEWIQLALKKEKQLILIKPRAQSQNVIFKYPVPTP